MGDRTYNWTRRQESLREVECFIFESTTLPLTIVVALMKSSVKAAHFLASLRLERKGTLPLSVHDLLRSASRQAENLDYKLRVIDALRLSRLSMMELFRAGRILFGCTDSVSEVVAWQGAADCVSLLQADLGISILTQPDYDQKYGRSIVSTLGNQLGFKTAHEPSTIGTVLAFSTVLERCSVALEKSRWAVVGIGDLGSRIVRKLMRANVERILIHDIDNTKVEELKGLVGVEPCKPKAIANVHAIVFSGFSGTLTPQLADRIARDESVVAVGGPEAGLDHDRRTIETMTAAGKHFIPSILCGSLGLVANLEESLNQFEDVRFSSEQLRIHVANIVDRALARKCSFQQEWKVYVKELLGSK